MNLNEYNASMKKTLMTDAHMKEYAFCPLRIPRKAILECLRLLIFATALTSICVTTFAQPNSGMVDLVSVKPVTSDLFAQGDKKFSINDEIFRTILYKSPYGSPEYGYAVYDLSGKFRLLTGAIGVADGQDENIHYNDNKQERAYRVAVDGKTVLSGQISQGDAAVKINIDISGAKSLRIQLDKGLICADPVLHKITPVPQAMPNPSNGVVLISPPDTVSIKTDSTTLRWHQLEDAVSYGVEIVCTKLTDTNSNNAPRLWTFNVFDGNSIDVDLSEFRSGVYKWSVIAFNRGGVMTKWSKERTFTLQKR